MANNANRLHPSELPPVQLPTVATKPAEKEPHPRPVSPDQETDQNAAGPMINQTRVPIDGLPPEPLRQQAPCTFCGASHPIYACEGFRSLTPGRRKSFAHKRNLCTNWLGRHRLRDCHSSKTCRRCQRRHHTLLHVRSTAIDGTTSPPQRAKGSAPRIDRQEGVCAHTISTPSQHSALLPTARVIVTSETEQRIEVRALLDPCSNGTFISTSLARRLHLRCQASPVPTYGVGGTRGLATRTQAAIRITSRLHGSRQWTLRPFILSGLSVYTPPPGSTTRDLSFVADLELADPNIASAEKVDIILGADIYPNIIVEGLRKDQRSGLVAQATELGWVLTGAAPTTSSSAKVTRPVTSHHMAIPRGLRIYNSDPEELVVLPTEGRGFHQRTQRTSRRHRPRWPHTKPIQLPATDHLRDPTTRHTPRPLNHCRGKGQSRNQEPTHSNTSRHPTTPRTPRGQAPAQLQSYPGQPLPPVATTTGPGARNAPLGGRRYPATSGLSNSSKKARPSVHPQRLHSDDPGRHLARDCHYERTRGQCQGRHRTRLHVTAHIPNGRNLPATHSRRAPTCAVHGTTTGLDIARPITSHHVVIDRGLRPYNSNPDQLAGPATTRGNGHQRWERGSCRHRSYGPSQTLKPPALLRAGGPLSTDHQRESGQPTKTNRHQQTAHSRPLATVPWNEMIRQ